jgi:hypothetical protein
MNDYDLRLKRLQERAQFFIDNSLRAFILDKSTDTYHFCFIKSYDNAIITVKDFKGKSAGHETDILLIDIDEIKLYKEKQNANS